MKRSGGGGRLKGEGGREEVGDAQLTLPIHWCHLILVLSPRKPQTGSYNLLQNISSHIEPLVNDCNQVYMLANVGGGERER